MTLQEKITHLKSRRTALISRARKETHKLEAQFLMESQSHPRALTRQIRTYSGRYYAVVGPLLKQIRELDRVLELLRQET